MIKGKDGKWYPTKAKMLEALPKVEEPKVEEPEVEKEPDNSKPFQKRMQDVEKILKLKEKGCAEDEIAAKVWIGKSYVEEVIRKGYDQMGIELKSQYHIVDIPEPIITSEKSEISEDMKLFKKSLK